MIDELCDSFTAEIRCTAVNDRMKAMCMKKKFIETITHHEMKILKNANQKAISEILKATIKNIVMQIKKKQSDNLVIISF